MVTMQLMTSLVLIALSIPTTIQEEKNPNFVYLEMSESAASGTVIYVISPAPPSGYFIKGDNVLFGLNKTTVVLLGKLDYEKQQHHIVHLGSRKDNVKDSVTLYVNVLNEYDEAPEITLVSDVYGIPEELAIGTDVGKVFDVKDADAGDIFTYALSGDDARFFHIDGSSGRIVMASRLDRDGPSGVLLLHHLFINVTDKGDNSAQQSLIIEILNINDNPPRFQAQLYSLLVNPAQTGSAIAHLVVNDEDRHGEDRFLANLSIIDGNEHEIFSLKNNYLHADTAELFEMSDITAFSLVVEARDPSTEGRELSSTAVVVVQGHSRLDVSADDNEGENKYAPVWIYPAFGKRRKVITVLESTQPGDVVLSVHAVDDDDGVAGEIRYSFTPTSAVKRSQSVTPRTRPKPEKVNAAGMFFKMDPEIGNLSVAMPLDRDKKTGGVRSFTIDVTATDSGRPPKSITSQVKLMLKNANDNAPSFSQRLYKTSYSCNVDLSKPIFTFKVTDDDNDNVKTVVIVDDASKMRYSLFKKGRPYALKAKQLPEPHVDKVDVITVAASDGDKVSTATILVRVESCSPTVVSQPLEQQTSTEVSKTSSSASTYRGALPETTTPPRVTSPTSASTPSVVTSRIVTVGGDEVVTVCSTAKVTTNNVNSSPAHTVTSLPMTTTSSPASAQHRHRCPGRLVYGKGPDNRPCCQCTGDRLQPGRRDVRRKTTQDEDDRRHPKKQHDKTIPNSTRVAVSNSRCRCSNETSDGSNNYSSGTISAIVVTSVAVPCLLATGVLVKKLALRGRVAVRDTPPEVTDSTADRRDASSR